MLKLLLDLLYPRHCLLCGGQTVAEAGLCAACLEELPVNRYACRRCALPLPVESSQPLCGRCLQTTPAFDSVWSAYRYEQPLVWMIQQLKFDAKLYMGSLLAELAMQCLPNTPVEADCLIPVPLHAKRLRQRGYNQSELLAKYIGRALHLPVDRHSCRKTRSTPAQTGKTAAQRRRNVRDAFSFENSKGYRHVLLLDDVVTTGSTVNEIAGLMKNAGVERVDVWSVARAPLKN